MEIKGNIDSRNFTLSEGEANLSLATDQGDTQETFSLSRDTAGVCLRVLRHKNPRTHLRKVTCSTEFHTADVAADESKEMADSYFGKDFLLFLSRLAATGAMNRLSSQKLRDIGVVAKAGGIMASELERMLGAIDPTERRRVMATITGSDALN